MEERIDRRRVVRTGLIGGAVGIYLVAVGIVEKFNERNILTGVIGLGVLLVLLVPAMTGYLAVRRSGKWSAGPVGLAALAGLISTGMLAALDLAVRGLGEAGINVREVLVSLGPRLLDILVFDRSVAVGIVLLLVAGAVLGGAGGALRLLPDTWRSPILTALTVSVLVSMLEPLLRVMLDNLSLPTGWLYKLGGMTLTGGIVVFVLAAAVAGRRDLLRWIRARRTQASPDAAVEVVSVTGRPEPGAPRPAGRTAREQQRRVVQIVAIVAGLVILPWVAGPFLSDVLGTVGLYVLLGLGLNIVVGYAGLLDLGYVAFFAVGAYATAIFTSRASFLVTEEGQTFAVSGLTNFWVALPFVVLIAVVIGVMIGAPVLRLRGDYLAIVTLGFGEIIRTLVLSDWLRPYLGGAQGIIEVPAAPPASLDLREPQHLYYIILVFCLLAAFISWRLAESRVGRAWAAMREDESVAEAMGVSIIKYKLLAFAMGAGIGCLGGAFFAAKIGSIFPNSFGLLVSINVLSVIILGGMGSIPGVVVGAGVLVGLPELLREFGEYRLLIYGAVLVAIMIYRPEGLLPNTRRRRELHKEDPGHLVQEPVGRGEANE